MGSVISDLLKHGTSDQVCNVKYGSGITDYVEWAEQGFFAITAAHFGYRLATVFYTPTDPAINAFIVMTTALFAGVPAWIEYTNLKNSQNPDVNFIANNPITSLIYAWVAAGWYRIAAVVLVFFVPEAIDLIQYLSFLKDIPWLLALVTVYYTAATVGPVIEDFMWLFVIIWYQSDKTTLHELYPPPNQPVCNAWYLRLYDALLNVFWYNTIDWVIGAFKDVSNGTDTTTTQKVESVFIGVFGLLLLPPIMGIQAYFSGVDLFVAEIAKALYC